MATTMSSTPSMVEYKRSSGRPLSFLITDAPKDNNLHVYLKLFKKHNVTDVVRISEPLYSGAGVESAGIRLHEMHFPDGESPPDDIIGQFLDLVEDVFPAKSVASTASAVNPCIVVHCVAGLGRAPVMVAIALIEAGLDPASAVQYIRERRRGAINSLQLSYLESYVPRSNGGSGCVIM